MASAGGRVGTTGRTYAVSAMDGRFSPEFCLMLACLRWPLGEAELTLVSNLSQGIGDWSHLLALCGRHRVLGLVWRALQSAGCDLPFQAAEDFRRRFATAGRQAMLLSAESLRLARLFSNAGVDAVFLKGATVAVLAYDDLTVRHAKDIDLLIEPGQSETAAAVLREAGYQPLVDLEDVSPERRKLWFRYAKSMDWVHARIGVLLELHWRLTDLPLLEGALPTEHRQRVPVARGKLLPTLESGSLLAYLCVHGAAHGWMRLKWLADVHALLAPLEEEDLTAAYEQMTRFGAGRPAAQAFLLCHDLLGLPLAPQLLRDLSGRASMHLLRAFPARLYTRGHETAEVDDMPFATTSVYLSRLLLGRGLHSLLSELRTWAYRPDQLVHTRLPRSLFFLFPFVRVGSWMTDKVRYRGRSVPEAK